MQIGGYRSASVRDRLAVVRCLTRAVPVLFQDYGGSCDDRLRGWDDPMAARARRVDRRLGHRVDTGQAAPWSPNIRG